MSRARQTARKQLMLYFGLVIVTSGIVDVMLIRGEPKWPRMFLLLDWTPGLSAIVCRVVFRLGIKDISFRLGGTRGLVALAIAWLYPLVVVSLAYGLAWKLGLATFSGDPARFWSDFRYWTTLGTLWSAVSAFGEELGWRGFMLTRLVDGGVRAPKIVSGVIWAVWHLPIIFGGVYVVGTSWASIVVFVVCITGIAVATADLRLATGSLWPAVLLHAAWNANTQFIFDPATRGGERWLGEGGLLMCGLTLLATLCMRLYYQRRRR